MLSITNSHELFLIKISSIKYVDTLLIIHTHYVNDWPV